MLLTVNAGSSSLKVAIFDRSGHGRLLDIAVVEIGGAASLEAPGGARHVEAPDHAAALSLIREAIVGAGFDFQALSGAGHRVVHGGADFTAPARIDAAVMASIEALSPFAPLHNPPALAAIRALAGLMPDLPQIACFDTAFHARQPETASAFALPLRLREKGIRRYGFHGLSYQGLVERVPGLINAALPDRLLALHLGNGASVCASHQGVGVATSMGFSPLDGLTMGTRCGAIDPAVVLRLARDEGVDEAERLLTRESGLKGLSNGTSDMRMLEAAGTPEAAFAIEHFCYWAARHSGSAVAAMGGVDLIAFTGGIGENAAPVRERIEALLSWTGAPSVVVPADEEAVIAGATAKVLTGDERRALGR